MRRHCEHCNGVGTLPVVYTFNGAAMPDLGRYFCNRCNGSGVAVESDRDRLCAFALALAVLTWLHGSQEPDARAELDAWMRAGIDAAKVKP